MKVTMKNKLFLLLAFFLKISQTNCLEVLYPKILSLMEDGYIKKECLKYLENMDKSSEYYDAKELLNIFLYLLIKPHKGDVIKAETNMYLEKANDIDLLVLSLDKLSKQHPAHSEYSEDKGYWSVFYHTKNIFEKKLKLRESEKDNELAKIIVLVKKLEYLNQKRLPFRNGNFELLLRSKL